MAVYLIGFALSLGLIAFGEKKRLPVFLAFSAAALLIPCLIAGLRAPQVGTDVMVYVRPLTRAAISSNSIGEFFSSYWFADWRNLYVQNYEIGFSLLVYVVANLCGIGTKQKVLADLAGYGSFLPAVFQLHLKHDATMGRHGLSSAVFPDAYGEKVLAGYAVWIDCLFLPFHRHHRFAGLLHLLVFMAIPPGQISAWPCFRRCTYRHRCHSFPCWHRGYFESADSH